MATPKPPKPDPGDYVARVQAGANEILAVARARKAARVTTPKPDPLEELAALADEIGTLDNELRPWALKIDRLEALRKTLRAKFETSPALEPCEAKGARFVVELGPRANQRTIDCAALLKALGARAYALISKPTLARIDAGVAPEIAAACISEGPTGTRPIRILQRAEVPVLAANGCRFTPAPIDRVIVPIDVVMV